MADYDTGAMPDPTLSTHVLDTSTGRPAQGVGVFVYRDEALVASATTDADGRVRELAAGLRAGIYRLVFEVAAYFRSQPGGRSFFARVALDIEIGDEGHYHVPLLVSRFGCVSYRGS